MMGEVLASRIPHIFFVYGLAFFVLGLALALELGRTLDSRFKRALLPLVVFGLVHGFHEWFEMFELIGEHTYGFVPSTGLEWVRLLVLAFSFLALSAFGLGMLRPSQQLLGRNVWFLLTMLSVFLIGVLEIGAWLDWSVPDWLRATDAWTRYALGIPGALLAAGGFVMQRRLFLREGLDAYANSLVMAGVAFALYGAIGQFMVSPGPLFPSTVINSEWFLTTFRFPVQLFRAAMAVLVAVFTIRALRAFDVSRRRQLTVAQQEAQEAVARRDALRGELLRRSVAAQEDDRRRIARELHDEIGQMLTGLATGLRGAQQWLTTDLDRARLQLRQLEGMTVKAIGELSNLVADLRPSLLDDMGLHATLGWYTGQINQRTPTEVELVIDGPPTRLPPEVEITLYRITQESLTNVVRHAKADHARVELAYGNRYARLQVSDDGVGFDAATVLEGETQVAWGLVGIRERVQLAGGECRIESKPGEGTTVTVEIPLHSREDGDNGAN
jgi:signal transduction histidine kinase